MKIPKIIVQTSKEKLPEYVVNMIKERAPDWEYRHYVDEEIIQYFKENPLPEFPDIIDNFLSIESGPHKADLFRYYFLYNEGGIYLDGDAMFETNLEEVAKDYDFFTVKSWKKGLMFQGFIGCVPKNIILYRSLKDMYNMDLSIINHNYFIIVEMLWWVIHTSKFDFSFKIYNEYFNEHSKAIVLSDEGKILLNHYVIEEIIPLTASY